MSLFLEPDRALSGDVSPATVLSQEPPSPTFQRLLSNLEVRVLSIRETLMSHSIATIGPDERVAPGPAANIGVETKPGAMHENLMRLVLLEQQLEAIQDELLRYALQMEGLQGPCEDRVSL